MRVSEGLVQNPEGLSSNLEGLGGKEAFWSFEAVQNRLVEAYGFLRRMPDREAGWLRHATMSLWQQIHPTAGLSAAEIAEWRRWQEAEGPRMPGLTRAEVARMEEALAWLDWIEPSARKVVGLAVSQLASGRRSRIAWGSLASDPTLPGSADRLRMAYGRALTRICNRLNAASKLA